MMVQPGPLYSGMRPIRDPEYLKFIRMLPCLVCSAHWGVEAAHTGSHGMGQKSSDLSAIPLCRKHHRLNIHSLHALGPVKFAAKHRLDIDAQILRLNAFYRGERWREKDGG